MADVNGVTFCVVVVGSRRDVVDAANAVVEGVDGAIVVVVGFDDVEVAATTVVDDDSSVELDGMVVDGRAEVDCAVNVAAEMIGP